MYVGRLIEDQRGVYSAGLENCLAGARSRENEMKISTFLTGKIVYADFEMQNAFLSLDDR